MKKKSFFLIISLCSLLCSLQPSYSQVNDNLIFSFDQFHLNTQSFAPSLIDTTSKINLILGDRSYKGVYNGINARFFQVNYLPTTSIKNQHHSIGVQFYQSNMGQYIRTNTVLGNYGFRIAISKQLALTSGVNIGYKSMILDPANVGGGGTSNVLSSSLGIGLISKKLTLLIGYKDFLNQKLKYNQFEVSTPVSYNFYLNYLKRLHENWDLFFYMLGEFDNHNEKNYRATVSCKWKNELELGTGYRMDKGTFALLGISNIEWQAVTFAANLSYLVIPNLRLQTIPNQVVELTLKVGY